MCTWPKVLSIDEAVAQWITWENTLETDPEVFHVVVGGALHIRVAVRLMVDYVSSTIRQNQVSLTKETKKKAEQVDIDKAIAGAGCFMDKMGAADVDLAAHAAAALKAGGANPLASLSDIAVTLPDVKALLPPEEEDEDDDADDGDGDDPDEAEGGEGGGRQGKKKKDGPSSWWRKEEFQIKKETELNGLIKVQRDALTSGARELRAEYEAFCFHEFCFACCCVCVCWVESSVHVCLYLSVASFTIPKSIVLVTLRHVRRLSSGSNGDS